MKRYSSYLQKCNSNYFTFPKWGKGDRRLTTVDEDVVMLDYEIFEHYSCHSKELIHSFVNESALFSIKLYYREFVARCGGSLRRERDTSCEAPARRLGSRLGIRY